MNSFTITDNLGNFSSPTILVRFKGNTGKLTNEYRFLLDTGAFFTMLSPGLVNFLQLPILNTTLIDRLNEGELEYKTVQATFQIENVEFCQICCVLEKEFMHYAGVLGTQF